MNNEKGGASFGLLISTVRPVVGGSVVLVLFPTFAALWVSRFKAPEGGAYLISIGAAPPSFFQVYAAARRG